MASTIVEQIDSIANQRGDRPFLFLYREDVATEFSYADVWRISKSYQAAFSADARRSSEATTIAIILDQGIDLIAAFWGAMMAGAIPTILPPKSPKQDPGVFWAAHKPLFGRINPSIIVCSASARADLLQHLELPGVRLIEPSEPRPTDLLPSAVADSAAPAFLQHSSGTTGVKKGVMLSHTALIAQVKAYAAALNLDPDKDSIASWLPLYHDMGLIACLLMPTLTGVPVAMMDPFEWVSRPTSLLDLIDERRSTLTWLPNFAFRHIAHSARGGQTWDLSTVRAFINCSEPCKPSAFEQFRTKFPQIRPDSLQVCYALAENTFATTQTPLRSVPRVCRADRTSLLLGSEVSLTEAEDGIPILSCGRPIPDAEIKIAGPNRERLGELSIGEIAMKSPFLASGYFALPDLTMERFVDGWYYSGDLGFIHDGELFVTGRKDDLLIVKGKNLYAHELERVVSDTEGVVPGRCVVVGLFDERSGSHEIIVMAEPTMSDSVGHEALRRAVRDSIFNDVGVYPKRVRLMPKGWLVKSTSGKISRSGNINKFTAEFGEIL